MRAGAWNTLLLVGAMACHGERWNGKVPFPRDVDSVPLQYREHESPHGPPGERLAYVLNVLGNSDVVHFSALPLPSEWAQDTGAGLDRVAGDGEYTGEFVLADHRRDPRWFFKTRPALPGEAHNPLPAGQEASHPYAHRRFMAGGAGGTYDNASVCPPGYVMTGMRYRQDAASRTLADVAVACRALPRDMGRTPTHLVEGGWWGEDNHTPVLAAECPAGAAVTSEGLLSLGSWNGIPVVSGVRLTCARVDDAARKPVAVLDVGFLGETLLPFQCAETGTLEPAPLSSGLRIIAGMRLDALGLVCDVGPQDRAQSVAGLRFLAQPSQPLALAPPLRTDDGTPLFAQVTVLDRQPVLDGETLELPVADAALEWRPMTGADTPAVSPLDGCVLDSNAGRVILATEGADCAASNAAVLVWLSGATFTITPGARVRAGDLLGALPPRKALSMRVVSTSLMAREGQPLDGSVPSTTLSAIRGPGRQLLVKHPPAPTSSAP